MDRRPWFSAVVRLCVSVAGLEGAQQAPHPPPPMNDCVFIAHFVSECLKIRLRYQERASKNTRASRARLRALDPGRKGLRYSRSWCACMHIIFCAPPPPPKWKYWIHPCVFKRRSDMDCYARRIRIYSMQNKGWHGHRLAGANAISRGGGGGERSTFNWSGCAAGGLKTGPCLKPLGARKIYPVLIYLTKDVHMHTLF